MAPQIHEGLTGIHQRKCLLIRPAQQDNQIWYGSAGITGLAPAHLDRVSVFSNDPINWVHRIRACPTMVS